MKQTNICDLTGTSCNKLYVVEFYIYIYIYIYIQHVIVYAGNEGLNGSSMK